MSEARTFRDSAEVLTHYKALYEEQQRKKAELEEQARVMPWFRAGTLLSAIVLGFLWANGEIFWGGQFLFVLMVGGFTLSVRRHRRFLRGVLNCTLESEVLSLGMQRLSTGWQEYPHDGAAFLEPEHAFAADLDVFGKASLFQLLNTTQTARGAKTLAGWLASPSTREDVLARQEAVRELREAESFRRLLHTEGLRLLVGRGGERLNTVPDPSGFLRWMKMASTWKESWGGRIFSWLSPLVLVVAAVGAHWRPALWGHLWWLGLLAIHMVLAYRVTLRFGRTFSAVGFGERPFAAYAQLFAVIDRQPSAPGSFLHSIQERLRADGYAPHEEMKHLQRILDCIEVRHSALLHFPLNVGLFWDWHCVRALEAWKVRVGPHVETWFWLLGELEAVCALSTFAAERPHAQFPTLAEEAEDLVFAAEHMGHPLLEQKQRVDNDLVLKPGQQMLLLTGSNMSGKSTWLRTMGINMVLAYAGSVVCAKSLHLSPDFQLATSMRVKDSLEQGISFFMAELHRMKRILDLRARGKPLFYLLDEILHGTNTRERKIAALTMLEQLLQTSSLGAVSSHDLEMSEEAKRIWSDQVQCAYLADQVEGDQMRFDYHLRSGICPTTNALALMRIVVGLEPVDFGDVAE